MDGFLGLSVQVKSRTDYSLYRGCMSHFVVVLPTKIVLTTFDESLSRMDVLVSIDPYNDHCVMSPNASLCTRFTSPSPS